MPNKNYIKGRKKEYKVKKRFELAGYTVLRTAGSHGFADLIAINERERLIRFIQCKPDNFSKREEAKLYKEHSIYNDEIVWRVVFDVI